MWKLYRRLGKKTSENKKGWKCYAKMLLLVLYFHFDHWIEVISCKCQICIFFSRQKYLMLAVSIFLLQEKTIWRMKDDKIPQTIAIVPATVKTTHRPHQLLHCLSLLHILLRSTVHMGLSERINKNNCSMGKLLHEISDGFSKQMVKLWKWLFAY